MTSTLSTVPATEHGVACGKCSHWNGGSKITVKHASVAAVRLCYGTPTTVSPVDRAAQAIADAQAHIMRNPARFDMDVVKIDSLPPVPGTVPTETVAPETTAALSAPQVEAGRYAVRGTDGVVKFYKIDKGRGRWEGSTFVSVMASDEEHPVRNRTTRIGILAAILVDPDGARRLYGQEIGRCARCNRTLTDETSRAYGMGPECRSK
jgi:hypothetical protein